MLGLLRPLLVFETQRQAYNRRPHRLRWVAAALAVFVLATTQFQAVVLFGTPLVGSGLEMTRGLAFLNYALVCVAAIGLFSSSITNERESGTLPLLVIANVPFRPFVFGKWMQYLLPAMLILLVEIPLLAGATFFGGITHVQTAATVTLLLGFLFFGSAVGMLSSVVCRSSRMAAVVTLAVLGATEFGPWLCREVSAASAGGIVSLGPMLLSIVDAWSDSGWTSTYAALYAVLHSVALGGGGASGVVATSGFQLAFGCVALGAAVALAPRLRTSFQPVRETRNVDRRESVAVGFEPVGWKEFRLTLGGWKGLGLRVLGYVLVAAVSLLVCTRYALAPQRVWSSLLGLLSIVAVVDFVSVATALFGRERRFHTLPTLVMTTARPGDLLWKKLIGVTPALVIAGLVLVISDYFRPSNVSVLGTVSWTELITGVATFLLWLHLIVLVSVDFPLTSVAIASMIAIVCWVLSTAVGACWLFLVGGNVSNGDELALAAAYFIGLLVLATHVACLIRIGDAAAK